MDILFYQFRGDARELNKSLENPLTKSVNIRTDIDIYNPILILQDFDGASYNYFLWDKRYYFITGLQYTANKIWRITAKMDVLMTYKDAILSSSGTLASTKKPDNYSQGANIPMTARPSYRVLPFPNNPFARNTDNYIMIATGGKANG